MSALAVELTNKCYETKDPYLDLGMCGIKDEDFAEGSPLDIVLRKCTHLQKLILSNEWQEWNEIKKERIRRKSANNYGRNFLTIHPPALTELHSLVWLICSGKWSHPWNLSDISFLQSLTSLQTLDLSFNQISDIRFLEKLTGLQTLNLSDNKISDVRFLENLTAYKL